MIHVPHPSRRPPLALFLVIVPVTALLLFGVQAQLSSSIFRAQLVPSILDLHTITSSATIAANTHTFFNAPAVNANDQQSDHLVSDALLRSGAAVLVYEYDGTEADHLASGQQGHQAFTGKLFATAAYLSAHPALQNFSLLEHWTMGGRYYVFTDTPLTISLSANPAQSKPLSGELDIHSTNISSSAASSSSAQSVAECALDTDCSSGQCTDGQCASLSSSQPSSSAASSSLALAKGNLAIQAVDIPARQYEPKQAGDAILKLQMTAQNEDVTVNTLRLYPADGGLYSIEYLDLYREEDTQPIGRLSRDYCLTTTTDPKDYGKMPFCLSRSVSFVVKQNQISTFTVRPKLRDRGQGFSRGEILQLSLTDQQPVFTSVKDDLPSVDATGIVSRLPLSLTTDNATGKIMIGRLAAGGYVQGPEDQTVYSKIVSIDGEVAPFPSSQYASSPLGVRTVGHFVIHPELVVTLHNILFTVNAKNIRLKTNSFNVHDDRYDLTGKIHANQAQYPTDFPCNVQTPIGDPVLNDDVTGTFAVSCQVSMNMFPSPGLGDVKLLAEILNERTQLGVPASIEVTLDSLHDNLQYGALGSHIVWDSSDADTYPFMWVDQPADSVLSKLIENPVDMSGGGGTGSNDDLAYCDAVRDPMNISSAKDGGTAWVRFKNGGNRTWKASDGYKLTQSNPPGNNLKMTPNQISLPNHVPPGQTVTFQFSFAGPDVQGQSTYQVVTQITRNGVTVPTGSCQNNITVGGPPTVDIANDDALCAGITFKYKTPAGVWLTSDSIPANMTNFVMMTANMKNFGNTTWGAQGSYNLSVNGVSAASSMTAVSGNVAPNDNKIFEGEVGMPSGTGDHSITVQMQRTATQAHPDGYFGQKCLKVIHVTP